jgi:hypothetical protein
MGSHATFPLGGAVYFLVLRSNNVHNDQGKRALRKWRAFFKSVQREKEKVGIFVVTLTL